MTYSIYTNTIAESINWDSISVILNQLVDNNIMYVTPHFIRDAIYTVYEAIAFKPTTNTANIEYIGLENTGPTASYEKMLFGKKQVSGVDILSATALGTNVDMFFYNNKTDSSLSNQNLKIGFMAGASPSIFMLGGTPSIPTIETKLVSNLYGNTLDFNIGNYSYANIGSSYSGGNINLYSSYGNIIANSNVILNSTITMNHTASAAVMDVSQLLLAPQYSATPSYVKGAIYFDTTMNKLRVAGATCWGTITSV